MSPGVCVLTSLEPPSTAPLMVQMGSGRNVSVKAKVPPLIPRTKTSPESSLSVPVLLGNVYKNSGSLSTCLLVLIVENKSGGSPKVLLTLAVRSLRWSVSKNSQNNLNKTLNVAAPDLLPVPVGG